MQLLHDGVQAVFAARQHRHNCAVVAQSQRHGAADAGGTTCIARFRAAAVRVPTQLVSLVHTWVGTEETSGA